MLVLLMGTPAPSWNIRATMPPDPGGGARVLVIDATHEPRVGTFDGQNYFEREPVAPVTFPGRATYLIPAEQSIYMVSIGERCNKGCSCPTPDGAKISIASFTTAKTWKLEARSEEQETRIEKTTGIFHRVSFHATAAVQLRVETKASTPRISKYPDEFHVEWYGMQPGVITWTAVATIEGVCTDAACKPPADAKVEITKIVGERFPTTP